MILIFISLVSFMVAADMLWNLVEKGMQITAYKMNSKIKELFENLKEILPIVGIVCAVLLFAIIPWVLSSYFESTSYNRLTGATTTTWDAMWIELRVQNEGKQ